MINFELPNQSIDDNTRLVYFVTFVHQLLKDVIADENDKVHHVILIDLIVPIQKALPEIEQHVRILKERTKSLSHGKIVEHGLTGNQLALKFDVVKYRLNKFINSRTGKLLKKLLDAVDTTLDSIIEAAGVGGAVKEFKDVISNATLE